MYEVFDHTADLGLRIRADSLPALFEDAARGFFSVLVANLDDVELVHEKMVSLEGQEVDLLLFDWLSELLYIFETEQMLFRQFDVQLKEGKLRATCRGQAVDRSRHELAHEVKAITYHGLKTVQQDDGRWLAEVIVDI